MYLNTRDKGGFCRQTRIMGYWGGNKRLRVGPMNLARGGGGGGGCCWHTLDPIKVLCVDVMVPLQWHNNERDGISNHWRLDRLLNRLFESRSEKTSNLWEILCWNFIHWSSGLPKTVSHYMLVVFVVTICWGEWEYFAHMLSTIIQSWDIRS